MRISFKLLTGLFAMGLLLFSCSEQETPVETTTSQPEPAAVDPVVPAQTQTIDPSVNTTAVADPNPAHGQPGHRCDVPVGASLSAAPAAGASTTITPGTGGSSIIVDDPGSNQTATEANLNPPHGQPGHDCAVPVGAPLPQ